VMAALLSSVSPVFASHFSSAGSTVQSVNAGVASAKAGRADHGRDRVANGDRSCGVDQIVSRSSSRLDKKISAEEHYKKLTTNQQFVSCNPNDFTDQSVTWNAGTDAMLNVVATDVNVRKVAGTPEGIQGYFDSFTLRGIVLS
ncbi:hypothetical protein ACOWKN_06255, partial [Helicobacter pylori]